MSLGVMGSSAGSGTGEYAIGTYTGTGSTVTLTFDKPPRAIIIQGNLYSTSNDNGPGMVVWIEGQVSLEGHLASTWPGSSVRPARGNVTVSGNEITLPSVVSWYSDYTYSYIAFF